MENKSQRTFEEIFPVLRRLTEKYTSKESTSVTNVRAQSLMEAVLYCMNEAVCNPEALEQGTDVPEIMGRPFGDLSADELYRRGLELVLQKVGKAKEIYNGLLPDFSVYRNRAYKDTMLKGMPEFFLYYDVRFEPQNHLLTLDYPLLTAVDEEWTGIDRIYKYLFRVRLENQFLTRFPEAYVLQVLERFHPDHEELLINICEVILKNALGHMLAGKPFDGKQDVFSSQELSRLELKLYVLKRGELERLLKSLLKEFVFKYCEDSEALWQYFSGYLGEAAGEILRCTEHECLDRIFLY